MAMEQETAQMTMQIYKTVGDLCIRPLDLLKLLTMIRKNDELTAWVKSGHELAEPFQVPVEYSEQFEALARAQGLPYREMSFDSKDNKLLPSAESGYVTYTCKAPDREQMYRLAKIAERNWDRETNYALVAGNINQEFKGVETSMINGLTDVEAEVIQKELSQNKIHSAMLYNAETKTYALEIAAQEIKPRVVESEMTDLEKAMATAVMKLSNEDWMNYLYENKELKNKAVSTIEQAALNKDVTAAIIDIDHPDTALNIRDGKMMLLHNSVISQENGKDVVLDLSNPKDKATAVEIFQRMESPVVSTIERYTKYVREEPEAFKPEIDKIKKAHDIEGDIDRAVNDLVAIQGIDFKITRSDVPIDDPDKPETLRGHDFAAKEFRLANTAEVKELIGKIQPAKGKSDLDIDLSDRLQDIHEGEASTDEKIILSVTDSKGKEHEFEENRTAAASYISEVAKESTPEYVSSNKRDQLLDNAQKVLAKLSVSQPEEHQDLTARINQYAVVAADDIEKNGPWITAQSNMEISAEDMYIHDMRLERTDAEFGEQNPPDNGYSSYGEETVEFPAELIDKIKDDMYVSLETGEALTYEQAMALEAEGPELDDALTGDELGDPEPGFVDDIGFDFSDDDIGDDDNMDLGWDE